MKEATSVACTVRDTENLPFSADTQHRFSEGSCAAIRPCSNARVASTAIRRSSARQCADVPRIYTMRKKSWDERASVRTRLKRGIGCWSSILAVMLLLRGSLHWSAILTFVQVDVSCFKVIRRCLWRKCVASMRKGTVQLRTYVPAGLVYARICVEFLPI